MRRYGRYNPRRINRYVPAMGYDAGIVHGAPYEIRFGPVALAGATKILSAQSIATAGSTSTFLQDNTDPVNSAYAEEFPNGPGFGRCLQVVASGAAVSTVTVKGRDYLGQPMVETFTLNGNTPVVGVKAFKYIDLISWGATAGTTINVGTHDKLGLPYRMKQILAEYSDGVKAADGSFVTPSLVDPATATTTDPRGTYDPTTVLDGAKYLTALGIPNGDLNSSGHGGLHGLQHYYA